MHLIEYNIDLIIKSINTLGSAFAQVLVKTRGYIYRKGNIPTCIFLGKYGVLHTYAIFLGH